MTAAISSSLHNGVSSLPHCGFLITIKSETKMRCSSNPKDFWIIINKDRPPQSVNDLPLDTFKKHFESLNSGNGEDIDRPNLDINTNNQILNEPFTEIEVKMQKNI